MRIARPFSLALATGALLIALLWGAAMAQTDGAPPPSVGNSEPSAYLTLDMQAGFALDPFLVSLNGGGEVDASTLDPACVGYINDRPVLTANWEGAVDFLRIFFYSDSDSTLVVQRPDGSYVCADDVDENVLDAELVAEEPSAGLYKIWVGSYEPDQLIPGLLIITARPDLSLASFDPRMLVKREPIAIEPEEVAPAAAVARDAAQVAPALAVEAATTLTQSVVATGTIPSFAVSGEDAVCGGMIGDQPDSVIDVQEGVTTLRIMFEADQDASLVVENAAGDFFCADDDEAMLNANPVLDLEAPAAGLYRIFVGRFNEDEPVSGTLTVTTDPTLEPAILAPAANLQE
jgi:hypothetical protein